ncbi:MAG TPA: DUF4255 domain-containing protein [Pyrinomonadaceae bacterium]|nr:DUF4255 domain-containing protein [Pyrinomonadaceae bacterium]
MAGFQAIAATGEAMRKLLANACPSEFSGAQFKLYQISDFGNPMDEGISLYLYRLAVSGARRTLPPTVGPDGRRYRPPIPLDLHYIASVWGKTAIKQQRLLGWMIRMFEDVPILPVGLLNDNGPDPEVFEPNETVEVLFESINLQDWNNLWSPTKTNAPLSVGYVARMIGISSTMPLSEAPHVQTRELALGKR